MKPDIHGRLWIDSVGLWLGTDGEDIVWFDAQGRAIGEYEDIHEQVEEAQARVDTEKARADKAEALILELEAELHRLRGMGEQQ